MHPQSLSLRSNFDPVANVYSRWISLNKTDIVLVFPGVPWKQSLRQGFGKHDFLRGCFSGKSLRGEREKQARERKKLSRDVVSDQWQPQPGPQRILEHKSHHKVVLILRERVWSFVLSYQWVTGHEQLPGWTAAKGNSTGGAEEVGDEPWAANLHGSWVTGQGINSTYYIPIRHRAIQTK